MLPRMSARPKPEEPPPSVFNLPDKCCGMPHWEGALGCVVVSLFCTLISGITLNSGNFTGFAIILCIDAAAGVLACVFFFGPRKFCRSTFSNGWVRASIALAYWISIVLTIALVFVDREVAPLNLIVLCLVLQKLLWALNLAASCGCIGSKRKNSEYTSSTNTKAPPASVRTGSVSGAI